MAEEELHCCKAMREVVFCDRESPAKTSGYFDGNLFQ